MSPPAAPMFAARGSTAEIETSLAFQPKFDAVRGLILPHLDALEGRGEAGRPGRHRDRPNGDLPREPAFGVAYVPPVDEEPGAELSGARVADKQLEFFERLPRAGLNHAAFNRALAMEDDLDVERSRSDVG